MIKIDNVHKKYKLTHALKGVSLEIEKGMFGLLGPNGAGKTTLMRMIMGLNPPTSGSVEVLGQPISHIKALREVVSYLPQEYTFYNKMTVYEAMDYMAILCNIKDKKERRQKTIELLKLVNLIGEKHKKVKALSGGMKRRLGLAQSLIKNPSILIVDEPTAGLDPEERLRIRNLLTTLAKDRIVIFSTHIVEDIAYSCDNLAIISEGKILFSGNKHELIDQANQMVWVDDVEVSEVDAIKEKYHVISMTPNKEKVSIRMIGEHVDRGSKVNPTLEDAYMSLMKREKNDQISA